MCMKVEVIILILLLSIVFVSGELSVSCTQDSDCALALGDERYSCVHSMCEKESLEEKEIVSLRPQQKELAWSLVSVEEKEEICAAEQCLFFAPEEEDDSWWRNILDFLFYL